MIPSCKGTAISLFFCFSHTNRLLHYTRIVEYRVGRHNSRNNSVGERTPLMAGSRSHSMSVERPGSSTTTPAMYGTTLSSTPVQSHIPEDQEREHTEDAGRPENQ